MLPITVASCASLHAIQHNVILGILPFFYD